jgi:hypothetical protein
MAGMVKDRSASSTLPLFCSSRNRAADTEGGLREVVKIFREGDTPIRISYPWA